MHEHPTRLLELAIGLGSRRLDPGRLQAPRTVDELRGSRRDARIVEHGFELGDKVRRGVGGSNGRVVAQEVVLGELALRGGGGRALGMFPSIDDTRDDKVRRNH